MTINLNVPPYYDDFDESKDFHQILFKPGYAIQARELTQIQSIIKNQIAKFGNHIFKHGSVVIPGNSYADLQTPFVKLQTTYSTTPIVVANWLGKTVIGVNGLKAVVKQVDNTGGQPTLYLAYLNGGGSSLTAGNEFAASEEIYIEDAPTVRAYALASSPTGVGSVAYINRGVYYINGTFVSVAAQSIVISPYDSLPSCHVLLRIDETIVDSTTDDTLLDPAQGSYNYAAPGADRVKISLVLTSLPLVGAVTDNYVEIMRYDNGTLQEHSRYPKYSELEKSLARRTFDESGDYVVSGLDIKLKEHLRTQWNSGVYANGNLDKFVAQVDAGKAYVQGFEVEHLDKVLIDLDKARTSAHVKNVASTIQSMYGRYMYVTSLQGLPDFKARTQFTIWNDNDYANGSATQIGTARVLGIDYLAGDPATATAIYKLYYSDLVLTGGYTLADAGGIRPLTGFVTATVLNKYTVPNASKDFTVGELVNNADSSRSATVHRYTRADGEVYVYKHDHTKQIPNVGEIIAGATSTAVATVKQRDNSIVNGIAPIFTVPVPSIKSTKTASNTYDMKYVVWKTVTVTTNGSGNGTATITDGTFRTPEAGITVAAYVGASYGSGGIVTLDKISLSNSTTIQVTGGPASATVTILTQVDKTNVQARTKTLVTNNILSGVTPATTISLGKADIYRIVSIFAGATDVTSSYILDNGQTDYAYGVGTLTLNGTLPTSNLTITFDYFSHSGTGDYFSVDSYTTLGSNYIALVPTYRSKTTADIYDLSNVLDFRPRIGDDASYTSGTALMNDTPVVETIITSSVQYYVPRIDLVYMDQAGAVSVKTGTPAVVPLKPSLPSGVIELCTLSIPAYTNNLSDIVISKSRIDRMTMKDINGLQKRIETLEYFSTLSAIETNVLNYNVTDAVTGLNRYKTGYLVDTFDNPFAVCDYYDQMNRVSFATGNLSAPMEQSDSSLNLATGTSSYYQFTGTQLTLPYTEVALINQPYSTRLTNVNPFLVFSWQGQMTLTPSKDSWIVTEHLPTVYDTKTETVKVQVPQVVIVDTDPPTPIVPAPLVPTANITYSIISVGDITVNEQDASATFNVTRTGNTTKATQVSYFTSAGTATAAADYTTTNGVLNFAANETNKQITVPILQDTAVEGSETFTVTLAQIQGGDVLEKAVATATILDDDSTLATVLNTPFFTTTNEGTTKVITVTRSGNVSGTSSVNYTTANATATAGTDYTATSGTLTWTAGVTTQTISVPITADSATEGNEYFVINFSNFVNCTGQVGMSGIQVQINDTSLAAVSNVSIPSAIVVSEDAGTASITVSKTAGAACSVNYSISAGSASAGSDYTSSSGNINFLTTGVESSTISVPIINDAISENDESFTVTIVAFSGSPTIGNSTCTVTISINDWFVGPPTSLAYQPVVNVAAITYSDTSWRINTANSIAGITTPVTQPLTTPVTQVATPVIPVVVPPAVTANVAASPSKSINWKLALLDDQINL